MGIRIDGNNDVIKAVDDTLTIEGISVNTVGLMTATGGVKVGTAATIHSTGQFNIGVAATMFANGNATFAGIVTASEFAVGTAVTIGKTNGNASFAGVVTASSFVGDGSGLTNAGPSLTGSTNNTIVTVTGANAIQGEANFTYDSDVATLTRSGNDNASGLVIANSNNSQGSAIAQVEIQGGDNASGRLKLECSGQHHTLIEDSTGNLSIDDNGTERLRIDASGGVGITTDKIHNASSINIAGVMRDYTNSGTDLCDAGGLFLQPTITLPSTGQSYPGIFWTGNTAATARARAGILGVTASNNDATDIVFVAKLNAGGAQITPADERVRITNSGRVGIASDVPSVPLDVIGDVHLGSKKFIFNSTSGHFGIGDTGDTTPFTDLTIHADAPQIRLEETSSGGSKRLDISVTAAGQATIGANQSSQTLVFETTGSERFRITADGVTFNGDTAAANGLDDYEEGTWTPTVHDGTISTGVCAYTKVGRLVTIVAKVLNFSNNSANDSVRIKSLPFTPAVVDCMAGTLMGSFLGQTNSSALYLADTNQLIAYGQHSSGFDNLRHNELNVSSGSTVLYIVATYMAS